MSKLIVWFLKFFWVRCPQSPTRRLCLLGGRRRNLRRALEENFLWLGPPFSLLQCRKNSIEASGYKKDWWEHVMEYSKEISYLLGNSNSSPTPIIEDPKVILKAVENDSEYWKSISSALTVGWLDVVVKLLFLHGSYLFDQLGGREIENGLVEAVVLISQMPRLQPDISVKTLGVCYNTKSEFMKAWEKWQAKITKLDCALWLQCDHQQTRDGLKNMLQIMLGNASILSNVTNNSIELYISHFLYIRPFTVGLENMYSLAQKCMQLKPISIRHKLMGLIIGILEENTEVILTECSRSFCPWMITHAIELLTAGSTQAEILMREQQPKLGGICVFITIYHSSYIFHLNVKFSPCWSSSLLVNSVRL